MVKVSESLRRGRLTRYEALMEVMDDIPVGRVFIVYEVVDMLKKYRKKTAEETTITRALNLDKRFMKLELKKYKKVSENVAR